MARSDVARFILLAFGLAGCTVVTAVDWTLIPRPDASAGSPSVAGASDEASVEAGAATVEGGAQTEGGGSGAGGA